MKKVRFIILACLCVKMHYSLFYSVLRGEAVRRVLASWTPGDINKVVIKKND